jgi:hypothetical protein
MSSAHPTWLLSSSISSSSGTPIFLFIVIGFSLSAKLFFLFFLLSKQLKHVIVIPAADIVHFSSHVLASHVMHLFIFVLLTQSYFPAMCVLFISDSVSYFLSQSPTVAAKKIARDKKNARLFSGILSNDSKLFIFFS